MSGAFYYHLSLLLSGCGATGIAAGARSDRLGSGSGRYGSRAPAPRAPGTRVDR